MEWKGEEECVEGTRQPQGLSLSVLCPDTPTLETFRLWICWGFLSLIFIELFLLGSIPRGSSAGGVLFTFLPSFRGIYLLHQSDKGFVLGVSEMWHFIYSTFFITWSTINSYRLLSVGVVVFAVTPSHPPFGACLVPLVTFCFSLRFPRVASSVCRA